MNQCCVRNVFVSSEALTNEIRELRAQLAARTAADPGSDAAIVEAHLAAADQDNRDLLALFARLGGYLHAPDQELLRGVRARIEDRGGKP